MLNNVHGRRQMFKKKKKKTVWRGRHSEGQEAKSGGMFSLPFSGNAMLSYLS